MTDFKIYFILFIYFWLRWVFVAVRGLSLVATRGAFSCCRARALGVWASVVAARGLSICHTWALECAGFSSRGAWALGCAGFSTCGVWAQ